MKSSFLVRYHHDIVTTPVKVEVVVKQDSDVLYTRVIDLQCYWSPLEINFDFNRLLPIQLIFRTDHELIQDHPMYIDRIEFDGLADIPFITHCGKLNQQTTGNCLYTVGELIYEFELPLIKNCNITANGPR